jgi:hypothetical protein
VWSVSVLTWQVVPVFKRSKAKLSNCRGGW